MKREKSEGQKDQKANPLILSLSKDETMGGQISGIIERLDDEAAKFAATRKKYLLY